jgi:hypothetical protein
MPTAETTIRRTDAVLDAVETDWRTTSYLDGKLYDRGFTWGPRDTRTTLRSLHDAGRIECQKAGGGYRWRLGYVVRAADLNPLPASVTELRDLSAQVARLAERLVADPPAAPAKVVTVGDDVDLADLTEAQEYLVKRIVKRAVYDTGKALLDVLDGWIEGAISNNEAMGRRDAADPELFHAADIRTMVNDAMRLMGAPEHRIPQGGE